MVFDPAKCNHPQWNDGMPESELVTCPNCDPDDFVDPGYWDEVGELMRGRPKLVAKLQADIQQARALAVRFFLAHDDTHDTVTDEEFAAARVLVRQWCPTYPKGAK